MKEGYDFGKNSNLVIIPKNRTRLNEPTGEPETLKGKIKASEMGIFAVRSKPTELLEKMKKRTREKEKEEKDENENLFVEKTKKNKKKNKCSH